MVVPSPSPTETDLFVPSYRPMHKGDWELRVVECVLCPGYWSAPKPVFNMAALVRRGATWMSSTPFEMESQEIGIRQARGRVVIFGLGLGWAAAASACLQEVTAVTVVECDEDVLALHRDLAIFDQLPGNARAKLRIERGDAHRWTTDEPVDLLMPDIWLPLVSDGRLGEVRRMQANVGADAVYFWGQELEIARHLVAAGRDFDAVGIRQTVDEMGLPLVGPASPGYADIVGTVARRWMRGRWLPGTAPPF